MALPQAVNNTDQAVCREIISSFERSDRIHPFSPYTMFVSKRKIPTGFELSNQDAMRIRNPDRGYTPRAESSRDVRSASGSRRTSISRIPRPAWGQGRGDPRSAPRDSRPRVTWSTETRGVGLGYNFPERNNPDISNHERNFREAFNGMQKKQKQSFVQSLYFQKYKSFETDNAPGGGPKLVTKIH